MPIRAQKILLFLFLLGLWGCTVSPHGVYHTVGEGQTLFRISRAYGVEEQYLARINGVSDPTRLRAGQQLFIPGADRVLEIRPPAATAPPSPAPVASASGPSPAVDRKADPPSPGPPAKGAAKGPGKERPKVKEAERPGIKETEGTKTASAAKPAGGDPLRFAWPVKGQVVRRFGESSGTPCQGVEIAAAPKTPVLSAAAGRVIYSGDGIRGYGNLIILEHDGSYFTVYGFNERNLVSVGTYVGRGEKIALSGIPPGGGRPRLHFEVRMGKKAVDPIFFLP